jgi:hypothetical protein
MVVGAPDGIVNSDVGTPATLTLTSLGFKYSNVNGYVVAPVLVGFDSVSAID